jgi:4-hydroxythreonine-4-phosphate dehydrogenase
MRRPRIAVAVGDPSGIGPEIAAAACADPRVLASCETVIYGPVTPAALSAYPAGVVNAASGQRSFEEVCAAVSAARGGTVDAVTTGPINKAAWALAGLPWKGHTDLLAHLCGVSHAEMLFWAEPLTVVLATVHVPLAEVPRVLTRERLVQVIATTAAAMPDFGVSRPRIGVAGVNPHAGEGGLLGTEDRDVLTPAVAQAQRAGIDVSGPFPADTVFVRAVRGAFDVVVAAFHDQGLVPVKLLAFGRSVNVTIGLPIIRTSVDHGTAFDIARRGAADPGSLVEAILLAARLVRGRWAATGDVPGADDSGGGAR